MSKGTFSKRLVLSVMIETITFDDISVDVDGTWDYDPGCWRTHNGDGWPETLEWNFELSDPTGVLTQIADQAHESDITIRVPDSEVIDAVHSAVDKHLSGLCLEDIMEEHHD